MISCWILRCLHSRTCGSILLLFRILLPISWFVRGRLYLEQPLKCITIAIARNWFIKPSQCYFGALLRCRSFCLEESNQPPWSCLQLAFVLSDLSLEMEPGTYIALVGASKSGSKYHSSFTPSSFLIIDISNGSIHLAERFYVHLMGEIYVNNLISTD